MGGGLCNKGESSVLFLQGRLCKEGGREVSVLPPSISYHVASHCSIVAPILHMLFAVVSCHCCFLVCLKSGTMTLPLWYAAYTVWHFFMVSYHFHTFHFCLDKKKKTTKPKQTSIFTRRVEWHWSRLCREGVEGFPDKAVADLMLCWQLSNIIQAMGWTKHLQRFLPTNISMIHPSSATVVYKTLEGHDLV